MDLDIGPMLKFGQFFGTTLRASRALGYKHDALKESANEQEDPRLIPLNGYWFLKATAADWGLAWPGLRLHFEKVFGETRTPPYRSKPLCPIKFPAELYR
jgi:hypothetical protein